MPVYNMVVRELPARKLLHRGRMLRLGRSEAAFRELGVKFFLIMFAETFAHSHGFFQLVWIRVA